MGRKGRGSVATVQALLVANAAAIRVQRSAASGEQLEDSTLEGMQAFLNELQAGVAGLTQTVAATSAQLQQQLDRSSVNVSASLDLEASTHRDQSSPDLSIIIIIPLYMSLAFFQFTACRQKKRHVANIWICIGICSWFVF